MALKYVLIYISFFFSVQLIQSQIELDTVPHLNLNQIRVSGTTQKKQEYSPLLIELKSFSDLQSIPKINIGEALSSIPGVYAATSGPAVFKPVVRGMQGNRVVTVWNGLRMEGQQWGNDHGLTLAELGLGGIEVIKGPASFVYGSDALGGVLFFRDEAPLANGQFKLAVTSKYNSSTQGLMQQAYFTQSRNKLRWHLGVQYGEHADIKLPNGMYLMNSRFSECGLKGGISFNSKKGIHHVKAAWYAYQVGIPESQNDSLPTPISFQTQIQERTTLLPMQTQQNSFVMSEHKWFFVRNEFQLLFGYTQNRLSEYEEQFGIPALDLHLSNSTSQGKWIWHIHDKVSLVSGIQTMFLKNWNNESAEEYLIPNGTTREGGVYSMLDLTIRDFFIQFGGRLDQRKLNSFDINFNPIEFKNTYHSASYSMNALYKNKNNQYRFTASSGFRAPHYAELLTNGEHHGALRYELGSTQLQPEKTYQFDVSAKLNAEHTSMLINPFYQLYQNFIFLNPLDSLIEDLPVYRYEQLATAQFVGFDFSLHHHPHFAHGLHTETNFSIIQPLGESEVALIPQPRISEVLQYEFKPQKNVSLNRITIEGLWCGSQSQVASYENPTSSYYTIDASVELKYARKQTFSMTLGVRNLTNQDYVDHLSSLKNIGISMPGRSFLISFNMEFTHKKANSK